MATNLRSKLIKLAHANPDLRPHLLPMLKSSSDHDPEQMQYLYEGIHKTLRNMEKASRGVDLALTHASWSNDAVTKPMWEFISESERLYAALRIFKTQWLRSGRMG